MLKRKLPRWLVWESNSLELTPYQLLGVFRTKKEADKHCKVCEKYALANRSFILPQGLMGKVFTPYEHFVANEKESAGYVLVKTDGDRCGKTWRDWQLTLPKRYRAKWFDHEKGVELC